MSTLPENRYSLSDILTSNKSSESCSSSISPKISSITSSIVIIPEVPPYSSTTIATLLDCWVNISSNSSPEIDSGTNEIECNICLIEVGFLNISNECT